MFIFKILNAHKNKKFFYLNNYGNHERDFTYISDIVSGVIASLDKSYPYEIFNLGNSKTVELSYFIERIEKELGKKTKKNLMPMHAGDIPRSFADISKAKRMLGFEPKVSIEGGIKKFIEWYHEYFKFKNSNQEI